MQCVPGFVLDPQTRRSTTPNQVRYPTDRQFVSGCSPLCLTATQLPSTTRSWLASTRTSTALMRCPLGRTDPGLRRDDDGLSLAGFNTHGCSQFFALNVTSLISSLDTTGRRPRSRLIRGARGAL